MCMCLCVFACLFKVRGHCMYSTKLLTKYMGVHMFAPAFIVQC